MEMIQNLHRMLVYLAGIREEYSCSGDVLAVINSQPPKSKREIRGRIQLVFPDNYFSDGRRGFYLVVAVNPNGNWSYLSAPQWFNKKNHSAIVLNLLKEIYDRAPQETTPKQAAPEAA